MKNTIPLYSEGIHIGALALATDGSPLEVSLNEIGSAHVLGVSRNDMDFVFELKPRISVARESQSVSAALSHDEMVRRVAVDLAGGIADKAGRHFKVNELTELSGAIEKFIKG